MAGLGEVGNRICSTRPLFKNQQVGATGCTGSQTGPSSPGFPVWVAFTSCPDRKLGASCTRFVSRYAQNQSDFGCASLAGIFSWLGLKQSSLSGDPVGKDFRGTKNCPYSSKFWFTLSWSICRWLELGSSLTPVRIGWAALCSVSIRLKIRVIQAVKAACCVSEGIRYWFFRNPVQDKIPGVASERKLHE